MTKFKVGDKVRVINYGSLIWQWGDTSEVEHLIYKKEEDITWLDLDKSLIGQIGIISKADITQGIDKYSIEGIQGKIAWYDNGQLELLTEDDNTAQTSSKTHKL